MEKAVGMLGGVQVLKQKGQRQPGHTLSKDEWNGGEE